VTDLANEIVRKPHHMYITPFILLLKGIQISRK